MLTKNGKHNQLSEIYVAFVMLFLKISGLYSGVRFSSQGSYWRQ